MESMISGRTIQMLKNGDCGGPLWKTDRFFLAAGKAQASGCKTIESKTTLKTNHRQNEKNNLNSGPCPEIYCATLSSQPLLQPRIPHICFSAFCILHAPFFWGANLKYNPATFHNYIDGQTLRTSFGKNQFTRVEHVLHVRLRNSILRTLKTHT